MHKEVKGGMPAGYRVPKANKGAHAFRDAASKITASERLLMAAVKPKADVSRDIACPFSGPDGRGFLQLPDAFRRVCSTSLPPRRHPRWHSRRRRRSCKRRRVSPHPSRPVLAEGAEAGESEAMSRMRLVDWRHPSTPISRVMEMVDARRRKMRAERGNRLALLRRAAGRGRGGATKPA